MVGFAPFTTSCAWSCRTPTLRSLSLTCTLFDFDLFYFFPLLEDLALFGIFRWIDVDRWNALLGPPKLTETFDLKACGENRSATRRLLSLSGGLHFSTISVTFRHEETELVTNLVSICSETLENLTLCYRSSAFPSTPVNQPESHHRSQLYALKHPNLTSPRPRSSNISSFGGWGPVSSGSP